MTPQRLHGKITSILSRLEWIDQNLAGDLVPGSESRMERLAHLADVLSRELHLLLAHLDGLESEQRLEIRKRVEGLRSRNSLRQNLLHHSRLVWQGLLGGHGLGGYDAEGRKELGHTPNLVTLTA